jgi:hypothetical protein
MVPWRFAVFSPLLDQRNHLLEIVAEMHWKQRGDAERLRVYGRWRVASPRQRSLQALPPLVRVVANHPESRERR